MGRPGDMTEQEAREYARRPEVLAAIKQGVKDLNEGRVRPWEDVARELGIGISNSETGGGNE